MRMLRQFLAWWGAELGAMLPARRPSLPDAVLLDAGGPEPRVSIRRRGREKPHGLLGPRARSEILGRGDRGLPVHLRASDDIVLHRRLDLPLDAEGTLRQAIAFQIDGLTPFKRDEVCFGHRVDRRDHGAGLLSVSLAVVPREKVAGPIAQAAVHGLAVKAIEAASDGAPIPIPLAEPQAQTAAGRGTARLFVLLAGLAAMLVGVAVYLPIQRLERRIADLNGAVERARDNALATQRLREKLTSLGETGRFFADRKAPGTLAVDVLGELTRRLPDSAWLTEFQAGDKQVLISGFAANASSLLGTLEASAMFANTKFRSPVTREGKDNIERFELSSDIVRSPAK